MVNGGAEGAALVLDAADSDKNDTKKRRFLRGLRRMFRRRGAREEHEPREPARAAPGPRPSALSAGDSPRRKGSSTHAHQSGLSVSHDSVFTAEASGGSGGESEDERARSASSASERRRHPPRTHHHHGRGVTPVTAELAAAVRRRARGDTSEEDEDLGLPRSPPSSPPKRGAGRVGRGGRAASGAEQSSCSEGSLLSAGSSEPEDEGRSSRGDLTSGPSASPPSTLDTSDPYAEEPPGGLAPLSHSAARHKMAVRPKRTHGAPRRTRPTQMSPGTALPTTPEVNEEVTRSITPEVISSGLRHSSDSVMSSMQHSTIVTSNSRHVVTTSNMRYEKTEIVSQQSGTAISPEDCIGGLMVPKETRLKSSSLPPGLALSQMMGQSGVSPVKLSLSSTEEISQSAKVTRSRSSAQKKDSSDTEDSTTLREHQQSISERNLSYQQTSQNTSMYKSMDMKFTNVLTGELQKKFGSVGEEEELLSSGNFESKPEIKYRKNGEKHEKAERHHEHLTPSYQTEKLASKNKSHQDLEEPQEKATSKKEESFFGRLLLRRSGKKNKKEIQTEKEEVEEIRKSSKEPQSYKSYNPEPSSGMKTSLSEHGIVRQHKMTCSDQHAHKSIGQKVFSNQNHKRIDPRGGYVNDPMIQESMTNFSKSSATEYGINDYKHFSEREKVAAEMQFNQSLKVKDDVNIRRLSSENITKGFPVQQSRSRQRMEPLDIPVSPEPQRKPPVLPRTTSQETKSFFPSISQGKVYPSRDLLGAPRYTKNGNHPPKMFTPSDDFPHAISPKIKMSSDITFGFSPTGVPLTTKPSETSKPLSYSVSPPRTVWPLNYDSHADMKSSSQGSLNPQPMRNSKSDYETRYLEYPNQLKSDFDLEHSKSRPKIAGLSSYQQKISQLGIQMDGNPDLTFTDSSNMRNPVIKSHSFRLNSDVIPMASQQDMPSLPPMFGISESSIDSWESTYKKNLNEASDPPTSLELGNDSLMSYSFKSNSHAADIHFTDPGLFPGDLNKESLLLVNESVEDTLQSSMYPKHIKQMTHYTKNIPSRHVKARDTDISRIEANIDSIIGSPKPLNCIALKSSSLDSVKSFSEKTTEQSRKALSNESISQNKVYINHSAVPDVVGSVSFNQKLFPEPIVSNEGTTQIPQQKPKTSQSPRTSTSENHVSVTVLNSEEPGAPSPVTKTPDSGKVSKQFDFTPPSNPSPTEKVPTKVQPRDSKSFEKGSSAGAAVPEFMKIQLNKVDQKPASNVVLSTSENKSIKTSVKTEKAVENVQPVSKKAETFERSISHEPTSSERIINEIRKSESSDRNNPIDFKETNKPCRKFSSEDVEILEKSDTTSQNNVFNVPLKKTGSQTLLNRSTELLSDNATVQNSFAFNKSAPDNKPTVPASLNLRKSSGPVSSLPPPSPTAHKNFIKRRSGTFDHIEVNSDIIKRQSNPVYINEPKPLEGSTVERNSISNIQQHINRVSSNELLVEQNNRIDRSSSSSDDSNIDSTVILRKKSLSGAHRTGNRKDDEPELMKVFARRSLKLKDSEIDAFNQDILKLVENNENKEDSNDESKKNNKYDFNIMTRSRDSDKENEADSPKDERKKSVSAASGELIDSSKNGNKNGIEFRKHNTETAELMQAQRMPKKLLDTNPVSVNNSTNIQPTKHVSGYGFGSYQRSVSANIPLSQACVTKTENKIETANYKKEVSDSTPEKRFRNRTFPDSNNENGENLKNIAAKPDAPYPVDTSSLPKRPWSVRNTEDTSIIKEPLIKPFRKSSFASASEIKTTVPSVKTSIDKLASVQNQSVPESEKVSSETSDNENGLTEGEADGSPQFKGILQMRAEWERRAKEAMTK